MGRRVAELVCEKNQTNPGGEWALQKNHTLLVVRQGPKKAVLRGFQEQPKSGAIVVPAKVYWCQESPGSGQSGQEKPNRDQEGGTSALVEAKLFPRVAQVIPGRPSYCQELPGEQPREVKKRPREC